MASGSSLEVAAAQVRLDPRLAASITLSGVRDVPTVLLHLIGIVGASAARGRALRAMATYPLILAASVACTAAIVFGMMGPIMPLLPLGGATGHATPLLGALLGSLALLVGLSLAVFLRLPPFAQGWERLDGLVFLDSVRVFVTAGAPLPSALRGAATWCRGSTRRRALALARASEAAGGLPQLEPLLDAFEGSLLLSAASAGALPQTIEALLTQRRLALERELPAQAMRIHVSALLLAGSSLAIVGGSFFATYSAAMVR